MAKKKKNRSRPKYRNAAPRTPASQGVRLAYTAAGAAGTALVGGLLAKENWQPKTIAGVLTAVGTALAWKGESSMIQSIGTGVMAAGGGQLTLQMMDDRYERALAELSKKKEEPPPARRQADLHTLRPGALEAAFERARMHAALTSADYGDE